MARGSAVARTPSREKLRRATGPTVRRRPRHQPSTAGLGRAYPRGHPLPAVMVVPPAPEAAHGEAGAEAPPGAVVAVPVAVVVRRRVVVVGIVDAERRALREGAAGVGERPLDAEGI